MKILRWLMGTAAVFSIVFTIFYGRTMINKRREFQTESTYKGIITLWNVDSFEGGEGSRRQFLMSVAREFERKYEGVLIMVTDHTEQSVRDNIKKGIYPDIISYGNGINIDNQKELNNIKSVKGGIKGNKIYATSWCKGGYVLIKNPDYTKKKNKKEYMIVSEQSYTEPLTAMIFEDIKVDDYKIYKPMDAYINFVNGDSQYMLGTQRDIIRLRNRQKNVEIKPINNYNDLYQYISITTVDKEKKFYSEKFIELLVSEKIQSKLTKISMFSPFYKINYQNEQLNAMENIEGKYTLSAYTSKDKLRELQNLSAEYYKGDISQLNKIKNIVI